MNAHCLPSEEIIRYLDGVVRCIECLCIENGVEKIKPIAGEVLVFRGRAPQKYDGLATRLVILVVEPSGMYS
jgi:hypothetical protein